RLDHVHELFDDVDVRRFERALDEQAEAVQAGRARLRRTACGGFEQQVLAARLQACGVDEIDELQRSDLRRRGLAGELHADDTIRADRDRLSAVRDRDTRLHRKAAR